MMARFLFLTLATTLYISLPAAGQDENEESASHNRLFWGGNFGVQLGTITNIELSPLLGYNITPSLSAGAGFRYEFIKSSVKNYSFSNYQTNIYGASLFTRYMLFKDLSESTGLRITGSLFAHAEYEVLSLEKKYFEVPQTQEEGRFLIESVLIGGGIYQPVGPKAGIVLMLLWNINESASSPYTNPIMRLGYLHYF